MRRYDSVLHNESFKDDVVFFMCQKAMSSELAEAKSSGPSVNDEHRRCLLAKRYTALFGKTKSSEINDESLLSLYNCNGAKCRMSIIFFMREAYKKGLISNQFGERLTMFWKRFTNWNVDGELNYLLETNEYDEFVHTWGKEQMDRDLCQLFFANDWDGDYAGPEIARCCLDEIHYLKLNTALKPVVCAMEIRCLKWYLENGLNVMPAQMSKEWLIELIKKSDKHGNLQVLLDVVYSASKYELTDCELASFIRNRKYYTFPRKKHLLNVLAYPHQDQVIVRQSKDNLGYEYLYIGIDSKSELFPLVAEWVQEGSYKETVYKIFLAEIEQACGHKLVTIDDLNFEAFSNSVNYYAKKEDIRYYSLIASLFNFIHRKVNRNLFASDGLDDKILAKPGIARKLAEEYKIVRYNPNDNPPRSDKFLLLYQRKYETNTAKHASESVYVNLTDIDNVAFRQWFKSYIWYANKGLMTKLGNKASVKYFLNYVNHITTIDDPESAITVSNTMAYIQTLKQAPAKKGSFSDNVFTVKGFLRYVNNAGLAAIPESVFMALWSPQRKKGAPAPISADQLSKLLQYMKDNISTPTQYIYFTIVELCLQTNLRFSEILMLSYDCIQAGNEPNVYIIQSKKKTTGRITKGMTIDKYTKGHIDKVLEITSEWRKECSRPNLQNLLFLIPFKRTGNTTDYRKVEPENIRGYIASACDSVGIAHYTPENLRDTFMTAANRYAILNGLNHMQRSTLTGHKLLNTEYNYFDYLKTMIEMYSGDIIGNVDIEGEIVKQVPEEIKNNEHEVQNGCGYCQRSTCDNDSFIECIICKWFMTDPSRLYYFKLGIDEINKAMSSMTNEEDRERESYKKRVYMMYALQLEALDKEHTENAG